LLHPHDNLWYIVSVFIVTTSLKFHSDPLSQWWNPSGPFKVLHQINPLRLSWIVQQLSCSLESTAPLGTQSILEIGCGGGLLSEPLSRLGASVMAIDQDSGAIRAAQEHQGKNAPNPVSYLCADAMDWTSDRYFDVILVMEVLEHVDNPGSLLKRLFSFLKPGGALLGSTINRTFQSHVMAIFLAESVLRWVPQGMHQWHRLIQPREIEKSTKKAGYHHFSTQGFSFSPHHSPPWHLVPCTKVNYFFKCIRPLISS
jgi:2-polyprenyl-6-hydroxyphenyl methylase / 3-demethylubiquinone-9 3-methyltransferase